MKVRINREDAFIEARFITITIGNQDFKLSVDVCDNLVINKTYGGEDGSIHITPSVSNEIRIN